jgi:YD repeat-containing protein
MVVEVMARDCGCIALDVGLADCAECSSTAARNIMPNGQPGRLPPMKPLLLGLILPLVCFASSNLYAQYPAAENEEWRRNKIKEVRDLDFSCHPDPKAPRRFEEAYISDYDSRGNLISYSTQRKWDEYPSVTTYKYDDKDNAIGETRDGRVWAPSEYTYDSKGLIAKRTIWNGDPGDHRFSDKQEFTRNDKGKVLERTSFMGKTTTELPASGQEYNAGHPGGRVR